MKNKKYSFVLLVISKQNGVLSIKAQIKWIKASVFVLYNSNEKNLKVIYESEKSLIRGIDDFVFAI